MRTIVYIDGFNLYHGCLKRASHCRWLDVEALAASLCREQNPSSELFAVKYFSAPVKAALSPHGKESCIFQQDYWLALQAHCSRLQIIKGEFVVAPGSYCRDTKPLCFDKKVRVVRAEEKQTDVNIALHILADAEDRLCEQQVVFTNDSDCTPALRMVRNRHPDIRLGVVAPIRKTEKSGRQPSHDLSGCADWTRGTIAESELLAHQLPEAIRTRKRSIKRPDRWRLPNITDPALPIA